MNEINGKTIKELITRMGISKQAFANRIMVSRPMVYLMLNNELKFDPRRWWYKEIKNLLIEYPPPVEDKTENLMQEVINQSPINEEKGESNNE